MKKAIKVMAAIMLVAAMVFSIASCGGTDMSKLKGDWTLSTINGVAPADKAAELGLPSYALLNNYNLGDKLSVLTYDPTTGEIKTSMEFTVEAASNGFTATSGSGEKISFIYDSGADTLSYSAASEKYVLKRGTTDILAAVQAAGGVAEGGEAVPEGGEEGGEEYAEGDYAE